MGERSKKEFIQIFSEANDLLRKEGIREGIERFTEFANILFVKLLSESKKKSWWDLLCNQRDDDIIPYFNNYLVKDIEKKYGDNLFSPLTIKNPSTLKKIINKLDSLTLSTLDTDIKGDAFEYFLKNSVSVGIDLGEYFTPRHIVKLMVDLVNPKFGDTVYDLACGTGGFLIEAFKHIKNKCKQTPQNIKILKEDTIYGREISGTATIAKMNMIIIGDGHNNIVQMDSLKLHVYSEYNVILTNFPFSQKTDYSFQYGFSTEDANPVFMKHVIDALVDGGIAGVIVPEGLLFDEDAEYVKIRKILLETCEIEAIIKLHEFVFKPYTGQPTSIIIFKKGKQTSKIWFFDVQEDGFKKTGSKLGRNPIKENDLTLLRQVWQDKEETSKSFSVDFKLIANQKYKLSMDKYRKLSSNVADFALLGGENGLCDIVIGGTPSRKDLSLFGGKNLWVKIKDMNQMYIIGTKERITDKGVKESNVKLLPEGTLLFSFKLTIGKVAIAGRELYTNEAIAGIIPKDKNKVLTKYLYYLLPHLDFSSYIQRATKGKTLNKEILKKIKIPLPSIEIQRELVKELDKQEAEKQKLLASVKNLSQLQKQVIKKLI
jgi:type I restriction enzyme M protein